MKKILNIALVTMFSAISALAQITTSSMTGIVTDKEGAPVPGVTVVAVHAPSGTQYYAIANETGRFFINGMRSGGPYNVEVSCMGYESLSFTGITLQLAETFALNAVLKENNEVLAEAVIISDALSKFSTEKTGAATNISNKMITALPTVTRSITEYTRLSPYGGNGMTFVGTDGRTANFTVDGSDFNNNFGLNDGLPGGGNPISIDAIEEMQVVISPYDVRQTNFIGGGVNAITKSGTNTFKGSAYIYHRNENMRGDSIDGDQIAESRAVDRNTTYGFTLGGPIVKNKLFFFVNAEYAKIPTVANRWRGSQDGKSDATNYISRTKLSDLQAVSDYVRNKYGYDPGSYSDFSADESNLKLLARLDWNISNKHHLAIRYNYTLNTAWKAPNPTSMDGGTRMVSPRTSVNSMSYANSMYSENNSVNSFSLDLNSRLSNEISNQFLATFSKLNDVRGSNSDEFPFIDITKGGDNYMALGYELFTWNNAVLNTVLNVKDDVTYYAGSHKITMGANFEYQMADNAYMRNGTGYYRYNWADGMTVDQLLTQTPEVVSLTYGFGGETNPSARVRYYKGGIYGQDEWSVNNNFKFTYGLRVDGLFFNNKDLKTNNAILELDYYDINGNKRNIDTGKWPTSKLSLSPRIGFIWDVLGDRSLKVRGGTGLFSGRLPLVFFTNMPTNGGMVQYQAQINAETAKKAGFSMDEFNGGLVTDGTGKATVEALKSKLRNLGYPMDITPEEGSRPSAVNGVDPSFRMPQVWKTSLAIDYSFPTSFPMSISAEGIFNKTINAVCISDWSIKPIGGFARFNGVDDRPIYPSDFRSGTKAFVLSNTGRGYGWSGSISLNMQPIEAISLFAAYTHTVSKEITSMPGSAAESAFTYVPTTDGPNNILLHNSLNVIPNRFIASFTLNDKVNNHLSIIYETWNGGYNYSYMTTNDMNGDGYNYDAIYIPTDDQVQKGQFRFVSTDDEERFMAFVHKDAYLSANQGRYAEAYSVYTPWIHRLDLSYKHDFVFSHGESRSILQVSFDIKNILNLFNSSWGVSKYLNPEIGTEARILKYEGADAEGYATFSTPKAINGNTRTFVFSHTIDQCWYASVGLRYMFN